MNPQDNPLFTAYALGELSAEEARELRQMLADTPGAAHELEQIEAVTDALRHGAPIPQARLSHEQRHAVLHPSNLPRRIQPMQPRKAAAARRQTFWPVMGRVLKAAAVVALSGAAFLAGWSFSPVVKDAAALATAPSKKADKPEAEAVASRDATKVETASEQVAEAPPAKVPVAVNAQEKAAEVMVAAAVKVEPVVEATPPAKKEVIVVDVPAPTPTLTLAASPVRTTAQVTVPAPPVVIETRPNLGFTMSTGRGAFASTTKQAADQVALHPALIKPVPPKPKGEIFASPQTVVAKAENKPTKTPEVYIHSWKSEVAPCPWNAAHRLLRLVIQMPADQVAVTGQDVAFPLQISFDPANVKQYRLLGERHLTAAELRSAGSHVLWYEFQPNGAVDVVRDRQIASVTLSNARFTSQAVGPFDSSKLQVIDRGYSLQNAREDFVFEASVLGFGMLLRGTEQMGSLNHALVLDLARKAKGADVNGERARFIRVVQDAQRVAGL